MKLIIEIKETPRGDVAVDMTVSEPTEPTRKEECYAINIIDLLTLELPKMCKAFGGAGAIFGKGKAENS